MVSLPEVVCNFNCSYTSQSQDQVQLEFKQMKVAELKAVLKERGLSVSGNRQILIDRLQGGHGHQVRETNIMKVEKNATFSENKTYCL